MTKIEERTRVVEQYLDALQRGDVDGIVGLFDVDAVIEDPVGSGQRTGLDRIREFYAQVEGVTSKVELQQVRHAGDSAAFAFRLDRPMGSKTMTIEAIEVMAFDQDNRIAEMRAYWSASDVHVA